MRWRRATVRLHLWGGLVTAPLIAVLGLSGAVLVFRHEIERVESGPVVTARARVATPSLDAVVAAARARYPSAVPQALAVPSEPGRPYRVALITERERIDVAVDPSTLQIVAGRAAARSVVIPVRSLHGHLHAGRAGAVVIGVIGLYLIVESLTGLWLCWPRARRRPQAIAARSDGVASRLHRVLGAVSLAIGVVTAVTGVLLAAMAVATLADARATQRDPGYDAHATRLDSHALSRLDMVAALATSALPGARITRIVAADAATIRVDTTAGSVIVDREAGTAARALTGPAHLSARQWIERLHAGDFAGWPSRIAYALSGLALSVVSITGFLITARRAAAR